MAKKKRPKKKGRGKGKGNAFERKICKQLSLWFTDGDQDDIFWRSAASGGRATHRARRNKLTTAGSDGDVCALDEKGIPFTDRWVIELKKGYNSNNIQNFLDGRACPWLAWAHKLEKECPEGKTWMIIAQRDRHAPLVLLPQSSIPRCFKSKLPSTHCLVVHNYELAEPLVLFTLEDFMDTEPELWMP